MRWLAALLASLAAIATTSSLSEEELDSEQSRKVLGSSVVTSVSVIMDHGNGTKTFIGESNDGSVGSPGDLLAPDRYEFYTFDESGDLVKKLMTLDQIQGLIAGGDSEGMEGDASAPTYYHEVLPDVEPSDIQGVHRVVANVQNVLKSELEATRNKLPMTKPLSVLSVPDAASSWTILLPGVLGGPLEDNRAPGSEPTKRLPSTTSPTKTTISQETNTETTENPIITLKNELVSKNNLPVSKPQSDLTPSPDGTSTWSLLFPSALGGSMQSNKIQEYETTQGQPSTTMAVTITTLEETTQRETTENPTIIHYLPIKNIPPPPKKNFTSHSVMTTTVSATTLMPTTEPSTIPVASDTTNTGTETMEEDVSTDSTQSMLPSSTSATSPETVPVMEEMAASLSSVLSQVADNGNVTSTLESNYISAGSSLQDFGTPGAESRPHTTKIQFSSTTPLTFTTHSQPLHVENRISTENPATTNNENNREKPQIKVTTQNKENIQNTKPSSTSTTERINNLTSLEYSNGAVSDYQMISEALAAQGIAEESGIVETISSGGSTTESTKNTTGSTSGSSSGSTEMTKSTSSTTATVKPVAPTKSKVPNSKPTISLDSATKTTTSKVNTTKNSTKTIAAKPPSTISMQSKPSTTKLPPPSKQQTSPSNNTTTYSSMPTATLFETSTQVNKRVTVNPNATTPITKTKTTTKKPNAKPTSKPISATTSTKLKNDTMSHKEESEKLMTKQEVTSSNATKSKIKTPSKLKNDTLKLSSTGATLQNTVQTATHQTSSIEDKNDATTLVYESKINNNSDDSQNYIASSSNRESITTNPTTESTVDLTTNSEIENEGERIQEGISAVTSILLQENSLPPVPANKFTGFNSKPVMGELKHASQISSDDMESTTVTKDLYTTTLDSTTEYNSDSSEGTTNENISTEKIGSKTKTNLMEEDSTTEYQFTTDAELTTNAEESSKITQNSGTTPFNASAIEFTTSVYEGTTIIPNESIVPAEKKTADYELEGGGQSTQIKESKLSPETNTKGSGIGSNLIDIQVKQDHNINKTVHNSTKEETHKVQSLNFVGNSTKTQIKNNSTSKDDESSSTVKNNITDGTTIKPTLKRPGDQPPSSPVELHPAPHESLGLEASTTLLGDDVRRFADLCNELAFRMWTSITGKGSIAARSLVLSPFSITSLLAMVFLGARGPTSGQMNDVLRLDDMVTFNPHQVLQNVTESVLNSKNYGVATAAFVRELYSDKAKGKILDFYKERAQQYYDGHVEEINFGAVGDILRRRTNLLIKRQTLGRVPEYLRGSSLSLRPPLAAFSANIFQTDCEQASTEGRDGEMYFVVRPSTRQRRLVPVPAAVWRSGFLAGYEPGLDATAVCLGAESAVSTLFILPGQQGQVAPGDGLARLEQRLIETSYRRGGWSRLLRSLLARPGLELQVPRFSHRSVLNVTGALQRMGLKDLFNAGRADLRGLNGLSNDLHLSDIVQINTFSTCAEDTIGARHHTETYPVSPQRMGREDPERYPVEFHDFSNVPLALRPRQARLPDSPRLRFDRPFLYMVRHNPTGMILYMGRFNPRLLP